MRKQLKEFSLLGVITLMLVMLTGCLSNKQNGLNLNQSQLVVMEPSVLASGVIVETPRITQQNNGMTSASISISNVHHQPANIMYRLYWYDANGLRIGKPKDNPLMLAADSVKTIVADNPAPQANHVRIYVFLPN